MSWDDGFWHKDSRDSLWNAGISQEMEQEHTKTPWECQVMDQEHPRQQAGPRESREQTEDRAGRIETVALTKEIDQT